MINTPPPVLLLGASGFLGPALAAAFGPEGAISTHCRHSRPGSVYFDVRETPVASLLNGLRLSPQAAVILLGITSIDDCARDPAGTAVVNVEGVIRVIDEVRSLGLTPVYVSSDGVFDGTHGLWREDDMPHPILEYGRQKLAVESYLSSQPPPWLIVRPPKLLDPGSNPRCMLTGWVNALGRDAEILCATDQYFTPAAAPDVARAIAMLVARRSHGLFHLGGPRRLSRRELLDAVITEYRRHAEPRARVIECSLRDIPVLEPRPLDSSLDSSRAARELATAFSDPGWVARSAVKASFSDGAK